MNVPYGFNDGWGQMPLNPPPPNGQDQVGAWTYINQADPIIDNATATSRLFVKWDQVQRCPNGPYDWTAAAATEPDTNPWETYKHMLDRDIQPIVVIYDAPQWASSFGLPLCSDSDHAVWHPRPDQMGAWGNFAEAVARKFEEARAIEIWNEPNLQGFWGGGIVKPNPHDYSQMLKVAGDRIKSVPSPPEVLLGGLWIPDEPHSEDEYLDLVYVRAGIKSAFDGIAIHPYPTCEGPENNTPAKCMNRMWDRFDRDGGERDVTDVRNANGDAATPFWITEVGMSDGDPSTPQQQANALLRMYGSLDGHLAPADPATHPAVTSFVIHSFVDLVGQPAIWGRMGVVSQNACVRKLAYRDIWKVMNSAQEGYPGDAQALTHNRPSYC